MMCINVEYPADKLVAAMLHVKYYTLNEETLLIKNLLSDLQCIQDAWEAILQETIKTCSKNPIGWEENFIQGEETQKSHKCVSL